MSRRTEASAEIQQEIDTSGGILLSRLGEQDARINLRDATRAYHSARKNLLEYDLASAFGVAVWGSARIKPSSRYGKLVRNFTQGLIEASCTEDGSINIPLRIVTGGGPGLMEAANQGAHKAIERGRHNNGINLTVINYGVPVGGLSTEYRNRFTINQNGEEEHPEFSTRKQRMLDLTQGIFVAAGGYGTLYEWFMAIQNRQTGHIESDYLIVAHDFWKADIDHLNDSLYHQRLLEGREPLISKKDLSLVQFVKKTDEAVEIFLPAVRQWWSRIGSKVSWTE